MIYLLNFSAFSDILRDDASTIARLESIDGGDRVVTSSIVMGEILYGIHRLEPGNKRIDLEARAEHLLGKIECQPVLPAVSRRYAALKADQQSIGKGMGENDLWIAATVMTLNAILVTRDSDFNGIDGLQLENWSQSA